VENLPVFGVIVFALYASQLGGATISLLSVSVLVARVMQSWVHICLPQTNMVAAIRFAFFLVQIVSFLSLIVMIVTHAASMS
jgi:LytS/YehU family sensor histidine kinase